MYDHSITMVTYSYSYSPSEGVAFVGPDPSVLTFTAGQAVGDTQCAQVTILDNSVLDGERNFSVCLRDSSGPGGNDGGNGGNDGNGDGSGAQIDPNSPSINIRIALDVRDGKSHHIIL